MNINTSGLNYSIYNNLLKEANIPVTPKNRPKRRPASQPQLPHLPNDMWKKIASHFPHAKLPEQSITVHKITDALDNIHNKAYRKYGYPSVKGRREFQKRTRAKWAQANKYKKHPNYSRMRSNVDSIILNILNELPSIPNMNNREYRYFELMNHKLDKAGYKVKWIKPMGRGLEYMQVQKKKKQNIGDDRASFAAVSRKHRNALMTRNPPSQTNASKAKKVLSNYVKYNPLLKYRRPPPYKTLSWTGPLS